MKLCKPTACEMFFYTKYACAYSQLFNARCVRGINSTAQSLAHDLRGESQPSRLKYFASCDAFLAAAKMRNISAVRKRVFKVDHECLENEQLTIQLAFVYLAILFERLVNRNKGIKKVQ